MCYGILTLYFSKGVIVIGFVHDIGLIHTYKQFGKLYLGWKTVVARKAEVVLTTKQKKGAVMDDQKLKHIAAKIAQQLHRIRQNSTEEKEPRNAPKII